MVRVLAYTANVHALDWVHDIAAVQVDETLSSPLGVQGNVWNTHKLELWTALVEDAEDGAQLLLLDADTAIVQRLDAVWDEPFDLAYTVKPKGARFPLNGGVIFLRVSDGTRRFMRRWRDLNRFFLEHPLEYQVWSAFYGGLNQTALGVLFRQGDPATTGLTIQQLPCLEWNCEDEHWARFDPTVTRIVHFKSGLQKAVFREAATPAGAQPLVALWDQLERQAMHAISRADADSVRQVRPESLNDQMVRPDTIETPTVRPLTRRERRRGGRQPEHEEGEAHGRPA